MITLFILSFFFSQLSYSNEALDIDVSQQAYQQYIIHSREYILVMEESSKHLREWRKKKLLEIFEERLTQLEKNLIMSNSSLITEFDNFIKENGSNSLDDILLIRLSQLNFEKANLDFNQEMKNYSSKLDLYNAGKLTEVPQYPVPNFNKTLKYIDFFLKNYTQSLIKDKALYLGGFCNEEVGKKQRAISYYVRLIRETPNSLYYEEVNWRLGEIYYDDKKYAEASEYYNNLIKIKGDFYLKSLYKLGAVQFAQAKYSESAKTFQNILDELSFVKNHSTENLLIKNEAIEYLATIWSNDQSVELSEKYAGEILYQLGQLYKKRLDEVSMRNVYAFAVGKYPFSYRMPLMYQELIENYEYNSDYEKANAYRSEMIQILSTSKWWQINEKYRDIAFQTQDILEFSLLKSAEYYAQLGYKQDNRVYLMTSRERYLNFITKYPWSNYSDRAKLELADLEYFLLNYEKASQYYFEIVNETESASIREEAAYSLIWSEVKKVDYNLNFDGEGLRPQQSVKAPFTKQENIFLQAALFYTSKIKYSSRRNKVLYKIAEIYTEHADFDSAVSYLNLIISDSTNTSFITVKAFRLLQELYNIKNDWKSVETIQELARSMNFYVDINTLDTKNLLQRHLEKLETAINFEFDGLYQKAALEYETVYLQSKSNELNDFLNAKIANLLLKSGDYGRAQNYISKMQLTKYKPEAEFLQAQLDFRKANFDKSAESFESFVSNHINHAWREEAFLNAISIRSQLKQPEKIVTFFSKNSPPEDNSYLYYEFWDALAKTQKFDLLLQAIQKLKSIDIYDYYKVQSYLLLSYVSRDDYLSFDRKCGALNNVLEKVRSKTAYSTYTESFCEYSKFKKIVSKQDTQLEEVVSQLNKIYSYKVNSITLRALNDVVVYSDLKNTNRNQFEQLVERGWVLARQSPLSKESFLFSRNVLNFFSKFPLSLSYMMNWNISLSEMFEFKNIQQEKIKWREIKPFCDSKNYNRCYKELKTNLELEYQEDAAENMILAALKLGDDKLLYDGLKYYIEKSNYSDRSRSFALLTGLVALLPEGKKLVEINEADPLTYVANALELNETGDSVSAFKVLNDLVDRYPQSPLGYFALAQIYFEKGYPELSRTVILNGYEASQNSSLLGLMYQLNTVTYTNTQIGLVDVALDTTNPELFGLGFAAIKNNDKKSLERVYAAIKNNKNWFDMVKSAELLYLKPASFRSDVNESNNYVIWLTKLFSLSKSQSIVDLENIKKLSDFGIRNPSFREIEKVISVREPAESN